jgi:hypothetical protein
MSCSSKYSATNPSCGIVLVNTICTSKAVSARSQNLTSSDCAKKEAIEVVGGDQCRLRSDDACIRLALLQGSVLIYESILPIGYPNNVDPFAYLSWFLEIAPDPFAAVKIEKIETDSVRSRWNVGSRLIVHAECPRRESACSCHAEIGAVGMRKISGIPFTHRLRERMAQADNRVRTSESK